MIKTKIKIQKYTRICFEKSKHKTKYFIILQQQLGAHVIILLLLLLLLLPIKLTSFVFPQKYEEAKTFCLFVQWWNLYEILLMFQQINFTDKAFCLVFCCALNWWKCYVFNVLQKTTTTTWMHYFLSVSNRVKIKDTCIGGYNR